MNRQTTRPASLPNEIWLHIFEHFLTPFQLKPIRLVCRNWNQLVRDSSKLLDRYTFSVRAVPDAVEGWHHVTTSCYTTVKVWSFKTGMLPTVPLAFVRVVGLVNPWITARQLVEMLKFLPNLTRLSVVPAVAFNYELYETMPPVQLDRLESLHLDIGLRDEFLCIFQKICPRLKSLQLRMFIKKYLDSPYGTKLLEFIRSTRNTLTEVIFNQIEFREQSLLRDIAAIEGLKLNTVRLTSSLVNSTDIPFLCESQTGIEALLLPPNNLGSEILMSIATQLPNLKELTCCTDLVDLQPILSNMPCLQKLTMTYHAHFAEMLDLSAWRNSNLLHLSLDQFFLDHITLLTFFKGSPNIRTLKLYFGSTIDIHDLIVVAGRLKELRQLTLFLTYLGPSPVFLMEICFSPFRKLRKLVISGEFCINTLGWLLENCPMLRDMTLARCMITDNDMVPLVQYMRNLTKLCFAQLQAIGVPSGQLVVQRCPKLETLTIVNCPLLGQFILQKSSVRVVHTTKYQPY